MLKNSKRQQGFTLIEVMIGVVILAIVIALGVPSYSTWIQNTKIRNAAESISNGLQLARSEAVARNTAVRFSLAAGSAWTVCLPDGGDCTVLQSRSGGDGSASGSNAVTVFANPAISDVTFDAMGRGTTIAIDVDISTSVLSADESRNLRVLVNGGNVRMCDPNTVAPDSRAC